MEMPLYLIAIPLVLILAAVTALFIIQKAMQRIGLPAGQIIYADDERWGKTLKPLYDSSLGLTGKPDYLIKKKDAFIPVEVKSTWAPSHPYDSHILQLAAYCLLMESSLNKRPPYGLLRYKNRTFKIAYTEDLKEQVIDLVQEIRSFKNIPAVDRSHNQANRCAKCGYRNICTQRL